MVKTTTGLVVAAALLLAGCGGDDGGGDDEDAAGDDAETTVTTQAPSDDPATPGFCEDAVTWQTTVADVMSNTDPETMAQAGDRAAELREIEAPEEIADSWDPVVTATADYLEAVAEAGPAMENIQSMNDLENVEDIDVDNPEDRAALEQVSDSINELQSPEMAEAGQNVTQFLGTNCSSPGATTAPE